MDAPQLLEEVAALRKKIVVLETAEADNEKLRKELNKLRVAAVEQKSTLELEFMNQLTGVARENALKLEELEGRLAETTTVNVALSEQLVQQGRSVESRMNQQIEALDAQHRKDLAQTIDVNNAEIQKTRHELQTLMESRDKLVEEFDKVKRHLVQREEEIESLQASHRTTDEESQRRLDELQTAHDALSQELQETKELLMSKDAQIDTLKQQLHTTEQAGKVQLEETQRELASLNAVKQTLEMQLKNATTSVTMRETEAESLKEQLKTMEQTSSIQLEETQRELASLKVAKQTLEIELKKASTNVSLRQTEAESSYASKAKSDSIKIKVQEANIRELTNQLEECKSNLSSAEYELDRFKSTAASNEASLTRQLGEQEKENMELKATVESQEKALGQQLKDISSTRIKELEVENTGLKETILKMESEKMEQKVEMTRLQRAKKDLMDKYEHEILSSKKRADNAPFDEQLPMVTTTKEVPKKIVPSIQNIKTKEMPGPTINAGVVMQSPTEGQIQPKKLFGRYRVVDSEEQVKPKKQSPASMEPPEFNPQEKKTTQIIRRLEESLKKEGKAKQAKTASLKGHESSDRDDQSLVEMQQEIASLHVTLDNERNQTSTLREEISKLKATAPSVLERKTSLLNSNPNTPTRTKPSLADSLPLYPVRDLVEDYEMMISSLGTKRVETGTAAAIDFNDVDGLRDALYLERQQVLELEAELTRQCEMNCTLLKEISWLAKETENNRNRGTGSVLDKGFEKKKIERLTSEVLELKQVLKKVEDEKTNLSNQFEKIADSDRREIDRLASELNLAKSKLAKAEETLSSSGTRFVPSVPNDRKEVDRLRLQVRKMEIKLTESQQECHQLRQHASTKQPEIEELRGKARLLEDQKVEVLRLQVELDRLKRQASRVEELECKLAKLQDITSDHASRDNEIAGLKSLVQSLESRLSDSDATKALLKEKETASELNTTIANLRSDLKAAEARVQALSDEVAQKELAHDESKTQLLNWVESMAKDLQKAKEQRDEIEMNCRTQHTGQIDTLTSKVNSLSTELERVIEERDQAQDQNRIHNNIFDSMRLDIDSKVEEFGRTHAADKDEISRLQTQVSTMEKQLEESLSSVETMKVNLTNREQVETTVENVQRENHHLLDSQISKLQEELASLRDSESEKERKLQLLVKAMESMEADTETTLVAKNAAVDNLEKTLAEKQGIIDRLSTEKEQLVLSMNDMTVSRRDEIDALQNELMEMSTRAANQAREIQTLKVQLEDGEYRKEETDRLRKRVRELSEQVANRAASKSSKPDADQTGELQVENSKLRQRLRDATVSLKVAEEKIRDLGAVNSSSKAMQLLRDRNVTLKFEVEKLTKKLRRLAERKDQKRETSPTDSDDHQSVPSARYSFESEPVASDSVEATRFMI